MGVLVVGQGGREHALAKALSSGKTADPVWVLPGSPGMGDSAKVFPEIKLSVENVVKFCGDNSVDFVVIGPEQPLVEGLFDELKKRNIPVVGCGRAAARLEGSKVFSKEFMKRAGVPTAHSVVVQSVEEVKAEMSNFSPPYVLKADGLAGGKGVLIAASQDELIKGAENLFVEKIFGESGERALLEQFQEGYELSVFVLTNGRDYQILPMAQDHKRLLDGQKGPNTGGMGTVAPKTVDQELWSKIETQIVAPSVEQLSNEGLEYAGVLFIGVMVTSSGPSVLEYNVRWGDPEAQVLLPLLEGSWNEVFQRLAKGEVSRLNWKNEYATCVVLAAPGYPEAPEKGLKIDLSDAPNSSQAYLLHAGTSLDANQHWVTSGGRVLNCVGLGESLEESRRRAYELADKVLFQGMQKRSDIGLGL